MRRVICIAAAMLALAGSGAATAQAEVSRDAAAKASSAKPADYVIQRPTYQAGLSAGPDRWLYRSYDGMGGWMSTNRRVHLVLQRDGNFVLYKDGRAAWQTKTTNGQVALWQPDGNLVVYAGWGTNPIWASNTAGQGEYLAAQDDGNVVIYNANWRPVWQTGTHD